MRRAARVTFFALVGVGAVLTLGHGPAGLEGTTALRLQSAIDQHAASPNRGSPRTERDRGLVIARYTDAAANVALFVPLGVTLALGWSCRRRRLIAILSALSAIIELLQATIVTSRSAQFSDWVCNSLGAALGVMVTRLVVDLVRARPLSWRRRGWPAATDPPFR